MPNHWRLPLFTFAIFFLRLDKLPHLPNQLCKTVGDALITAQMYNVMKVEVSILNLDILIDGHNWKANVHVL